MEYKLNTVDYTGGKVSCAITQTWSLQGAHRTTCNLGMSTTALEHSPFTANEMSKSWNCFNNLWTTLETKDAY